MERAELLSMRAVFIGGGASLSHASSPSFFSSSFSLSRATHTLTLKHTQPATSFSAFIQKTQSARPPHTVARRKQRTKTDRPKKRHNARVVAAIVDAPSPKTKQHQPKPK
jgi:hypothetical protein